QFAGDVTGTMVIQGAIGSTGYRSTTPPSATASLDADDLLQGGPALLIEGNVTGGIRLAIAPKDNSATDKDEDKDGIEDAKEGNAAVVAYGAAPAVAIGATGRDIVIGPAGSASAHGLVVEGSISGQGVYAGINATGLAIGGRGGAVTIANGIALAGSVDAVSNGASATAVLLGSGANVAEVRNAGTISAAGGNAASARTTAVLIDTGATVPAIRNSGTIKAVATGTDGTATAILDRTGGLTLIENSGAISASGAAAVRNVAIDLSANSSGATVRQIAGGTASIVGRVLFGSGNDVFDVSAGAVTGDVSFGAGNNTYSLAGGAVHQGKATFGAGTDALGIAGAAKFIGDADFGGGAGTLTLAGTSLFSGALLNTSGVAVTVNSGTLHATNQASLASLSVGATGTLVATLDSTAGEGTRYTVAGVASFASGATLSLALGDIDDALGRHTILQAGSLTGASTLKTSTALMPFIFKATLATDAPVNTIAVDVSRKTAQELNLNRSQGTAFDAIFAALDEDEDVEDVFLEIRDGDQLRGTLGQMLPDHAGGAFEGVSRGVRTFARQVADPQSPVYTLGGIDLLFSAAGWSSSKDQGQTAIYDLGGFGFSAAGEVDTGIGAFGVSASLFWNDYDQGTQLTNVESDTYELAAYWRGQWDGLSLFARGSLGKAGFEGNRTFQGTANGEVVSKQVEGEWDGTLMTIGGGVSYEMRSGSAFVRPAVSIDYISLSEDGYSETGGGDALDLTVDERTSDELAGNAGLAIGLDFLGRGGGGSLIYGGPANRWFRVEAEGGWRETLGGSIGSTTARFDGGAPFTLAADQAESGWYAQMRAVGGGSMFELGGEVGAEQRNGETGLSMRGTVRIGF
ncbi:MAG TPA: autotransporter domain-containing protein, partial [Croceibacterium sp.]